jgi:hypothetical protein
MREILKSELNRLLDVYDSRRDEAQEEDRRRLEAEEAFVNAFRGLCSDVIRPGMQEIGETLRRRGHDYRISEDDEGAGRDGRPRSARIILSVSLDGSAPRTASPAVGFAASRRRRRVCVYVRIPPHHDNSTPRSEYEPERVTAGVVECELLAALKEILKR